MKRSALALAALALSACPAERPGVLPRAHGEVVDLATLREYGVASVAADRAHVFVATWHGIKRLDWDGRGQLDLYDEPLGGVLPSLLAIDETRVFFARRRPCDDVGAAAFGTSPPRRPECSSVLVVGKDGGPARVLAQLARDVEPAAIAADARYVYYAENQRVMRASALGGTPEPIALGEERVHDVAVDGGRPYWVEGDFLARPKEGSLVTQDDTGKRRIVGRADAGRASIGFDAGWVYWISEEKVWRADKRGGAPESLGEARTAEAHLAVDSGGIVWTEWEAATIAVRAHDGRIARDALHGAKPTHVALAGPFAFVAAIDDVDGSTKLVRVTR